MTKQVQINRVDGPITWQTILFLSVTIRMWLLRLYFTKSKTLIGIAISTTTLSLVELNYKNKRYHLLSYGLTALSEGEVIDNQIIDSEQMGQHIAALIAQLKCTTKKAAIALGANLVITREIELPTEFSEQDIDAQIRVDADQYIPYSLSEVNLDFAILGRSLVQANYNKVLLVISRSEHIEQHSDALVFAGLKPSVIDTEPEARQRAFQFLSSHNTEFLGTTAWVDIGQTRLTIYIAFKGEFVYHLEQLFGDSHLVRAIATHYNLSAADAEQAKLDPQLVGSQCLMDYDLVIFQPFIQSLIDYIKVAFERYIAISPDKEVEQIILSGDAAGLPQLDKSLQHQMGLPVTLVNPFLSMRLSHSIDEEQLFKDAPQLMTACGLAMRSRTMTQIY